MRIESHIKPNVKMINNQQGNQGVSPSFRSALQQSGQQLQDDALRQLLGKIEEVGSRLSQNMTLENLTAYKKLVKQFMHEAVQFGLELELQQGFNRRGRTKQYQLVKEVDHKLIELTDEVMQKEKDQLQVLELVGEIKGMLINIYT